MVSDRRNFRGNVLLFGFLVVICVLCVMGGLLEVGLRLLGYRGAPESIIKNMMLVDDPVLDWRYVPNSHFQEGNVVYQYNERGFRGENHVFEKSPGTIRVVVLGDSVTDGYGVQWSEGFVAAVQYGLGNGYEVINLGMGGINTPQEIHLLEKIGIKFAPDYAVVNFILNDGDFYSSLTAARRADDTVQNKIGVLGLQVSPALKRWLKSSAFIYFVKVRLEDLLGRFSGAQNHDYYMELWKNEQNKKKISEAFDKLSALSQQHGFQVVVLIWPLLIDYQDYRFGFVHEWVADAAKTRGFTALDLLPVFSASFYRNLQVSSEDHVHPNAAGHELAAAQFVRVVSGASSNQARRFTIAP